MKTLKVATCQTFTTRVFTGRKSVKTQMKRKKNWLGENLDTLFFVLNVFFKNVFYKMVFDRNVLLFFFFSIQTLAYMVILFSNFVCQLKKITVYGWLSLLAMEPVAQTGVWIWCWVQWDFKGNARRAFLLLRRGYAHRETSHDTMCTSSRIVKCK